MTQQLSSRLIGARPQDAGVTFTVRTVRISAPTYGSNFSQVAKQRTSEHLQYLRTQQQYSTVVHVVWNDGSRGAAIA